MRTKRASLALLPLLGLIGGPSLRAQEAPPPTPEAAGEAQEPVKEPIRFRPIEGPVIINLPSVDVPRDGTLTVIFTHRFRQPVQDADEFHDLFSFDNGADIGIGLGYAPIRNLDISFYRSSSLDLDPWEVAAKYRFLPKGPFGISVRVGGDIRSEDGLTDRTSFFVQAILAYSFGERVRITAVPTYVDRISGRPFGYFPPDSPPPPNDRSCQPTEFGSFLCSGLYENVFNVPAALSVAVTRSVTLHAEVTPRYGKADSIGVGWIASIEKALLRHRFCFTVGNQRQTTVDQYAASLPYLMRFDPSGPSGPRGNSGIYLGFNIIRQWLLK